MTPFALANVLPFASGRMYLTGSTAVLFFLIHNACQRQGLEIIYETIIKIIMQLLEVTSKGNALLQGEFIYL